MSATCPTCLRPVETAEDRERFERHYLTTGEGSPPWVTLVCRRPVLCGRKPGCFCILKAADGSHDNARAEADCEVRRGVLDALRARLAEAEAERDEARAEVETKRVGLARALGWTPDASWSSMTEAVCGGLEENRRLLAAVRAKGGG